MVGKRRSALRRIVGALVLGALMAAIVLVGIGRVVGYRTYQVRSGSMGEAAPVGSVVVTRPKPASMVDVGDVILLPPAPGAKLPVLHRVIERDEVDGQVVVLTKGDANADPDHERAVLVRDVPTMKLAVPQAGFVVGLLQTPLGWFVFVVVPILGLALNWVRRYWSSDRPSKAAAA